MVACMGSGLGDHEQRPARSPYRDLFLGGRANCFIDVRATASKKVEPLSNGDDDDSSDGDSSNVEQGRSGMSKRNRWSDLHEQRVLAYKRASLGTRSSASSQAGLRSQYAHAGTSSGPEASRLPPAGGQAVAQALCVYLSFVFVTNVWNFQRGRENKKVILSFLPFGG
jgi:hypothetical protein